MPWAILGPIVGGLVAGAASAAPGVIGGAIASGEADKARKERMDEIDARYGKVQPVDMAKISTPGAAMGLTSSPFAGNMNPGAPAPPVNPKTMPGAVAGVAPPAAGPAKMTPFAPPGTPKIGNKPGGM